MVGVIDREPPKLYGLPTPSSGTPLWPGEEIAFEFTEPIQCKKPYRFDLTANVTFANEGTVEYSDEELLVTCRGKIIAFKFDELYAPYDELLGRRSWRL